MESIKMREKEEMEILLMWFLRFYESTTLPYHFHPQHHQT